MFPASEPLAGWADSGKDGLVTNDREAGLFGRDLPGEERLRHIDIDELAAGGTANMVMTVGALVEAAGLVAEWEFEDQAAFGEEMERAVDGAVGDRWIAGVDTLKDLAGRQVTIGPLDGFEDGGPLWGHPEVRPGVTCCGAHVCESLPLENQSYIAYRNHSNLVGNRQGGDVCTDGALLIWRAGIWSG